MWNDDSKQIKLIKNNYNLKGHKYTLKTIKMKCANNADLIYLLGLSVISVNKNCCTL